ncbi:MAG: hypothetical protein ACRBBW_18815 [Cellvibrionaceae bacterium]
MIRKVTQSLSLTGLLIAYSSATIADSAEVIGRAPDNIGGRLIGGSSAFLLGGAAGGPFGALAGGLVGALIGDETQSSAGLSGNTYIVQTADGEIHHFRSPQHEFTKGDKVIIDGIRIRPAKKQL